MTPIGLPFFSVTSRPSDPGVVKFLSPDWESHFFFFFLFSSTTVFSVLYKKANWPSMFFCPCIGPCKKETKSRSDPGK